MGLSRLAMLAAACCLWSATATAQAPTGFENRSPWVTSLQGGVIHQFDTDIDAGGSFSVTRGYIEPSVSYVLGPAGSIGVSLGYGYSDYDFSAGALRPWNDVHDISLSLPVRFAASENLQLFAAPSLSFDYESGADAGDSVTGGAVLGAGWRVNDRLFIGPGAGVFSGLEEDLSFFPVLLLDWKLSDTLALKTGSGLSASRGPGLSLEWNASQNWTLGLGARYEEIRFRLDDTGPNPGGVGEDRAVPIFLTAGWNPSDGTSLTAIAGVETAGRLSTEDAAGRVTSRTDYDPGAFLGFAFSTRF